MTILSDTVPPAVNHAPVEGSRSADSLPKDWRNRAYVRYVRSPDHPLKLRIERLLRRILGLRAVIAASDAGVAYELVDGDWIQAEILRVGSYEPRSLALMQGLLAPGDTMVDVGGHVGQYALHAAQRVGSAGRVIAFEPNPLTFLALARNVALNEFDMVTPILAAIGDVVRPVQMSGGAVGNWGTSRQVDEPASGGFWSVTVPLQVALSAIGVERIDVLKVDVEGFEASVFASIDFESALRPRNILFEYIPDLLRERGVDPHAPVDALRKHGYIITDIAGQPFVGERELEDSNLWARDSRALAHV